MISKMLAKLAGPVALSAVALSGSIIEAQAQAYPTKPLRLIVSVQPGGNSTIGLASVARSAPDGYTFVMVAQSALIAPRMMRNAPFDPVRDFAGVSLIATLPQMLVVHPSLPVKS